MSRTFAFLVVLAVALSLVVAQEEPKDKKDLEGAELVYASYVDPYLRGAALSYPYTYNYNPYAYSPLGRFGYWY